MDMCEYLEAATSQIRARRAREMVARELRVHMEDQAAYCLEQGMSEAEAESEAVRQMGDPVEVGISMDRIHRPKTDWKMIVMLVFLCVLGLCLQIAFNRNLVEAQILIQGAAVSPGLFSGVSRDLLIVLAGAVALGVIVCVMDYSQVLKYMPWFICLVLLVLWVQSLVIMGGFYRPALPDNWFYLLVPLYAGLLYRCRDRGRRGFVSGILLLLLMQGIMGLGKGLWAFTGTAGLRFSCVLLMMLSMAAASGWYGDKIRGKLLCLWGGVLMTACLAALWMLRQDGFRAQRIRAILHPFDYAGGAGYYAVTIRSWVGRCRLWGNPEATGQFAQNFMGADDIGMAFCSDDGNILYLFLRYGIMPGILVCLVFLGCIGYFLYRCLRQKNQLGRVTGAGCCMVFLVEFAGYLLSNFGILPCLANLPFLSYGGIDIEVWAVLMGFVFSIIRYQNLLPTERIDAARKFKYRLKIEKIAL